MPHDHKPPRPSHSSSPHPSHSYSSHLFTCTRLCIKRIQSPCTVFPTRGIHRAVRCGWQINSKWETHPQRERENKRCSSFQNQPLSSDCVRLFLYEDALGHRPSGGGCEVYLSCLEQGANATQFRGLISLPFTSPTKKPQSHFAGRRTQ